MVKLNLGCGAYILPGWINIDNFEDTSFDKQASREGIVRHDLTTRLPFENESASFIFHSHVIEHMPLPQAQELLRECYRILKPGGVMRLCTPDLTLMAEAYLRRDKRCYDDLNVRASTHCELFNIGARAWGHKFCFDEEDIRFRLEQADFERNRIVRVVHGESMHAELKGIDNRKPGLDMCLEAGK